MDMNKWWIFLFPFILIGCGVSYTTSQISGESNIGYPATVLHPEGESNNFVIYLSDSTDHLNLPSPILEEYLTQGYTIIIPDKWGDNGRARAVLDNFDHRLQGVAHTLETQYYASENPGELIIVAEGLYTPIAIRVAQNFRAKQVLLLNPLAFGLERYFVEQRLENVEGTPPIYKQFNIQNDSILRILYGDMRSSKPQNRIYGPAHSNLLHSYWSLPDPLRWMNMTEDTKWYVVLSDSHPYYCNAAVSYWQHANPNRTHIISEQKKRPNREELERNLYQLSKDN